MVLKYNKCVKGRGKLKKLNIMKIWNKLIKVNGEKKIIIAYICLYTDLDIFLSFFFLFLHFEKFIFTHFSKINI